MTPIIIFLFLSFLSGTNGIHCYSKLTCSSVSLDDNFVDCIDNQCVCRSRLGFVGKATSDDKCRCNMRLYWEDGKAYCTYLQIGVMGNLLVNKQRPWLNMIKAFYNMSVFPYNEMYINGLQMPDIFEDDVKGAMSQYWEFRDKLELSEFMYGLSPNRITSLDPLLFAATGFQVLHFSIDIDQNRAYTMVSTNVAFLNNLKLTVMNVTDIGIWRFSDNNKIQEVMITKPFCSELLRSIGFGSDIDRDTVINETCELHTRHCTGPNQ